MSDPNELMTASQIAPLFGMQKMLRKKGGVTDALRFAYRHDVEAAVARLRAEEARRSERRQLQVRAAKAEDAKPAPVLSQDVALAALLRSTEELTRAVSVLTHRLERVEGAVFHLTALWDPPTTGSPPINGTTTHS
ncbi:MAG: hypothetical protein ACK5XA_08600 [Tagaea sp.]